MPARSFMPWSQAGWLVSATLHYIMFGVIHGLCPTFRDSTGWSAPRKPGFLLFRSLS
jgi:hypothetical protein